MRILLINHYAGSIVHGMEYRPFYLAREWVRLGHQVTVVAASYSHVRTKQPEVQGRVLAEEIEGVRYLWLPTPTYSGNGTRRAANIFAFISQLFRHRRLLSSTKPNAVIASSTYPLDAVPASRIARTSGAKFIFEVHDLWPLSPIELGGMSRFHPFIALMQGAENFAYRRADWVVSMLPNAESHMRRHGLSAGKFVYLPNGVHPSEWREGHDGVPALHYEAIRRMKAEGRFLVGYAGAHGVANALDCVVHAATLLRDTPVVFALFGNGAEKRRLMDLVSRLNLVNVKFFPPVPKSAVPDLFDCMDVLLITLQRNSIFRFGISPNKLLDYMMAAKPIIQAIDASNDMVRESGCGISVRPEDPNEIAAAALRMLELSALQRMEMGKRGRSYVTAHHDYRVLAAQFLAVLQAKPPTDVSTCETNYAQR